MKTTKEQRAAHRAFWEKQGVTLSEMFWCRLIDDVDEATKLLKALPSRPCPSRCSHTPCIDWQCRLAAFLEEPT